MNQWQAKAIVRALEACTKALIMNTYSSDRRENINTTLDGLEKDIDHAIDLAEM